MPNNKSLQFLRGNSTQRKASSEALLAGQPFFEMDSRRLYVGPGNLNALSPVAAPLYMHRVTLKAHSRTAASTHQQSFVATFTVINNLPKSIYVMNNIIPIWSSIAGAKIECDGIYREFVQGWTDTPFQLIAITPAGAGIRISGYKRVFGGNGAHGGYSNLATMTETQVFSAQENSADTSWVTYEETDDCVMLSPSYSYNDQ